MRLKDKKKTLAAGASVALATSGLSSCQDNGAVDPPPPPLECNAVGGGQTLSASATVAGRQLRVTVVSGGFGALIGVQVSNVVGGAARTVIPNQSPVVVVIDLADDTVTSGAFTLSGTILGAMGERCAVSRTFTFAIGPAGVVIASADALPLPARQQARIAMVAREGHEVELQATTPFDGPRTVLWSVTGGEVLAREGARLRWRLPTEPGLYQAELAVDYGASGLSFDTLVLEVI